MPQPSLLIPNGLSSPWQIGKREPRPQFIRLHTCSCRLTFTEWSIQGCSRGRQSSAPNVTMWPLVIAPRITWLATKETGSLLVDRLQKEFGAEWTMDCRRRIVPSFFFSSISIRKRAIPFSSERSASLSDFRYSIAKGLWKFKSNCNVIKRVKHLQNWKIRKESKI